MSDFPCSVSRNYASSVVRSLAAASVAGFLKSIFFALFRQGRAERVQFTLDDARIKQAGQGGGVHAVRPST